MLHDAVRSPVRLSPGSGAGLLSATADLCRSDRKLCSTATGHRQLCGARDHDRRCPEDKQQGQVVETY